MRLTNIAFRGVTRFTSATTVDLEALGPGLIALVGRNGEGKTTTMEVAPAALFKSLPTRPGSLYDHCHGRDAFVEADFLSAGVDQIKVRVQIDTEARKTEGYVFVNGVALTTGRSAEFVNLVERLFGSQDLFFSSVFARQDKAGNFLLMQKTQRKALFAELLGLSYLEALHEDAKARVSSHETALTLARARLEAATTETASIETKRAYVHAIQGDVEAAAATLATAREEEAAATSALERARGAAAQLAALAQATGAALRERETAERDVKAANAAITAVPVEAARRLDAIKAQDPTPAEKRARERYAAVVKRVDQRREQLETLLAERPAIEQAAANLPELEEEHRTLDAFETSLVALRRRLTSAESELAIARVQLTSGEQAAERERERLRAQASLLDRVPCTSSDLWAPADVGPRAMEDYDLAGECPLLAEARKAKTATVETDPALVQAVADHEAHVAELTQQVEDASLRCDALRLAELVGVIASTRRRADRLPQLEQAARDLAALGAELDQAREELGAEQRAIDETRVRLQEEEGAVETWAAEAVEAGEAQRTAAMDRWLAAREQHDAAALAEGRLKKALDTVTEADARFNLDQCKAARERAETALRSADNLYASESTTLARLEARANEIPALQQDVAVAEREVGDWKILEQALGRDGVQALEIDAAGPEVAKLTNELLSACYGSRFSISFETLREKKSARGEFSEAFDVKVFDQGRERAVEALSGGERVIVGEAVSLALAVYNARKNRIRYETLWRDETAGALDPNNAQAYVDLLRRAMALGGFHQVLFVSHSPEVWERADVRLVVEGGRVAVDAGAGASEAA